jgi:hypothetical protein
MEFLANGSPSKMMSKQWKGWSQKSRHQGKVEIGKELSMQRGWWKHQEHAILFTVNVCTAENLQQHLLAVVIYECE